jgi:large conductance mechanosensitive channel
MSVIKEFRDFAVKGNVIDMAVGIIIGAAFGKIVSSLVNDIIMPPIGALLGGVNFTDLKILIKDAVPAAVDGAGKAIAAVPAVSINYGNFIQTAIDFTIIAFAIFIMIKAINSAKKKKEEVVVEKAAPEPTKEEILLTEIRDLLKK